MKKNGEEEAVVQENGRDGSGEDDTDPDTDKKRVDKRKRSQEDGADTSTEGSLAHSGSCTIGHCVPSTPEWCGYNLEKIVAVVASCAECTLCFSEGEKPPKKQQKREGGEMNGTDGDVMVISDDEGDAKSPAPAAPPAVKLKKLTEAPGRNGCLTIKCDEIERVRKFGSKKQHGCFGFDRWCGVTLKYICSLLDCSSTVTMKLMIQKRSDAASTRRKQACSKGRPSTSCPRPRYGHYLNYRVLTTLYSFSHVMCTALV